MDGEKNDGAVPFFARLIFMFMQSSSFLDLCEEKLLLTQILMKAMLDILDQYLSSKQCGSIAEISVPAFNEVDELIENNVDSLKDQYNMYMGWAMKSVKDKLTFSKMKHKESILLITIEFAHLRHEKSATVEETRRFSMGKKGELRIPDIRLRCWSCAVLIFTSHFVSIETLSNYVIAIGFKKLCASYN